MIFNCRFSFVSSASSARVCGLRPHFGPTRVLKYRWYCFRSNGTAVHWTIMCLYSGMIRSLDKYMCLLATSAYDVMWKLSINISLRNNSAETSHWCRFGNCNQMNIYCKPITEILKTGNTMVFEVNQCCDYVSCLQSIHFIFDFIKHILYKRIE